MKRRDSTEELELHRIMYGRLGTLWTKLDQEDQDEIVRILNKVYTIPERELPLLNSKYRATSSDEFRTIRIKED